MKSVVFLLVALALSAHTEEVTWGSWQLMRDCHGAHYEFRASAEPANERVAFRVTNRSGEPFATTAMVKVQRDDGSWVEIKPLVAGTPPTGGYEGWIAPNKTVDLGEFDVAAPNPHPITGERAAGMSLEVGAVSVMTRSRHKDVVSKLPPGAYFSMKDGERCDKTIVEPFGWRSVVRSQKTADGRVMRLSQQVTFSESEKEPGFSIRLQVKSDDTDVYNVTAKVTGKVLRKVSVVGNEAQALPLGTYWCVRLDCAEQLFRLTSNDGQSGTDSSGLLYFRSKAEAAAAVQSISDFKKG